MGIRLSQGRWGAGRWKNNGGEEEEEEEEGEEEFRRPMLDLVAMVAEVVYGGGWRRRGI